jgi:hypothetical protein
MIQLFFGTKKLTLLLDLSISFDGYRDEIADDMRVCYRRLNMRKILSTYRRSHDKLDLCKQNSTIVSKHTYTFVCMIHQSRKHADCVISSNFNLLTKIFIGLLNQQK